MSVNLALQHGQRGVDLVGLGVQVGVQRVHTGLGGSGADVGVQSGIQLAFQRRDACVGGIDTSLGGSGADVGVQAGVQLAFQRPDARVGGIDTTLGSSGTDGGIQARVQLALDRVNADLGSPGTDGGVQKQEGVREDLNRAVNVTVLRSATDKDRTTEYKNSCGCVDGEFMESGSRSRRDYNRQCAGPIESSRRRRYEGCSWRPTRPEPDVSLDFPDGLKQ